MSPNGHHKELPWRPSYGRRIDGGTGIKAEVNEVMTGRERTGLSGPLHSLPIRGDLAVEIHQELVTGL